MEIQGKLIIIGGAVDKGSFTETNLDKDASKNLNFFETGILKRIINESKHIMCVLSNIYKEINTSSTHHHTLNHPQIIAMLVVFLVFEILHLRNCGNHFAIYSVLSDLVFEYVALACMVLKIDL